MKSIFLTGSSGFVGINLQSYLSSGFQFKNYNRGETVVVKEDIVIHLAGKAHDTKNVAQPEEYYQVNTELTKKIFDAFMHSTARVFITLSSVKAAADLVDGVLTEEVVPNPQTHYGKSKLLAEQYILAQPLSPGKRIYIIRPCMIHGPSNKGNLNLLYRVVSKNLPWPLAAFSNRRSFCSIENLCFVINELIHREEIPSGVYNMADDEALSTNDLIRCIAESLGRQPKLLSLPTNLIQTLARLGDWLKLPLNSERLQKLTESYVVS
ncbi:MAG: NAD-dependent epimerase/dehydratase family protein, partial [Bacteroidota bacterium]